MVHPFTPDPALRANDADPHHTPDDTCACDLCVAAELLDAQTFPWELGHEPVAELCREVA